MDVLSQLICKAVNQKVWKPSRASRTGPEVSHIFFADDLLLFGEATEQQVAVMDSILTEFCAISGQRISLHKSVVYTSKNTRPEVIEALSQKLQMGTTDHLGRYLGMPMLHSRVTSSTYKFLVDNIKEKLAAWKTKVLSQAARALLIHSVLSTLPSYVMQTMASTIAEMEKHMRDFYWDELDGSKHLHYIVWENICQPNDRGGSGVRRLHRMNIAFLAKLGWQLINDREPLWVRILLAKYGSPLEDTPRQNVSVTWRSIRRCAHLLRSGVSPVDEDEGGAEARQPKHRWELHPSSKFSVASAYKVQTSTTMANKRQAWHRIRRMKGPYRENVFMWRLRMDVLPTTQFLLRRHISANAECPICGLNGDNMLHDIRDCAWASKVWRMIVDERKWNRFCKLETNNIWVDLNLRHDFGRRDIPVV